VEGPSQRVSGHMPFMRLALQLARRGYGTTSPNPMVGAVLVSQGKIIGRGWHHRAGEPHAEIEALRDARRRRHDVNNATLYVTLEPCSTHGRTPPCTEAIIEAGIQHVVTGAIDPNPLHRGKACNILRAKRIRVTEGILATECEQLNEAFNHWIVHRTPFVTVKAAMTLDGKIATASGESKWITGEPARAYGMKLRQGADAIMVGINTIIADDPSLTVRGKIRKPLRRIILDSRARTPLNSKILTDESSEFTTIVVTKLAPSKRVAALSRRVKVILAPLSRHLTPPQVDMRWLLQQLGAENVLSLLVEGGGEVNATFLLSALAHRLAFFYSPKVLGGRDAKPAVGGTGNAKILSSKCLRDVRWGEFGRDLLLTARLSAA
jgi:diaminohydroxyphosphoribosylaminopyrimidine deaminase / 5-amino-6-(5-phosphoribosylamino)uracil reductase